MALSLILISVSSPFMLLANIKNFLLLYFRPARAVSGLIDSGSWWLALAVFVAVSFVFHFTVKERVIEAFGVETSQLDLRTRMRQISQGEDADPEEYDDELYDEERPAPRVGNREVIYAGLEFEPASRAALPVPGLGRFGRWLLWTMPQSWLAGMAALCLLYVPATIFALSLLEPIGSFGVALRRDFGTLVTCVLMAWSATHLPFAVIGLVQDGLAVDPAWFFLYWAVSTAWFGGLVVVTLRVVFGCGYDKAAIAVLTSWPGVSLGARVLGYLSAFLFSPFILIFLWMITRGEVGSIGASYRQRQRFRRYLESSTINPRDADAHYQLGLIYLQRRQEGDAESHFRKAIEIDPTEIDARYQLGKIARQRGQFAEAIEHFGVVVAENEKHAQSEIWREVGATYLGAGMYAEAREALEKYVERRSFDPEGLYYLGETMRNLGQTAEARSLFERCLEAVQSMPYYRRADVRRWSKLAKEQLAAAGTQI
jgi:Tfp pilus assembly protein PilF